MNNENYFSSKMRQKSNDELNTYILNIEDFQEEAVLAAIAELENRGVTIENATELKTKLTKVESTETFSEPTFEPINTKSNTLPLLYSTKFIYIFGALFSVFGGGILMALNFVQLKNIRAARNVVLASLGYTLLLSFIFESYGIQNAVISLATSLFGVYLLYEFIWKKEVAAEITAYKERDIWKPILIGLAIALPLAYVVIQQSGML